jgi:hypothetical protein
MSKQVTKKERTSKERESEAGRREWVPVLASTLSSLTPR